MPSIAHVPVRSYVWGLDLGGNLQGAGGVGGLLWANTPTHSFAASHDANGNIVAYINTASLAVSGRADYGAFGERVQVTGVAATLPFGFSTKYTDAETGLLYYGFRYYNPGTGRWLSRDPIEERGGLNLYGMVGNDGVNNWDYLGWLSDAEKKERCRCVLEALQYYQGLQRDALDKATQLERLADALKQPHAPTWQNGTYADAHWRAGKEIGESVISLAPGQMGAAAGLATDLLNLPGNLAEAQASSCGPCKNIETAGELGLAASELGLQSAGKSLGKVGGYGAALIFGAKLFSVYGPVYAEQSSYYNSLASAAQSYEAKAKSMRDFTKAVNQIMVKLGSEWGALGCGSL